MKILGYSPLEILIVFVLAFGGLVWTNGAFWQDLSRTRPQGNAQAKVIRPEVAAAKAAAFEIAKKPWRLKDVHGENQELLVDLEFQGERLTLRIGVSHFRHYRFSMLQDVNPDSIVRFEVETKSLNEADLSSPELDAMPEYYLSPTVTSIGHGPSFFRRRIAKLLSRQSRKQLLFLVNLLHLTQIKRNSRLPFVLLIKQACSCEKSF